MELSSILTVVVISEPLDMLNYIELNTYTENKHTIQYM